MYRKTIIVATLIMSMFSVNSFAGGKNTKSHVKHTQSVKKVNTNNSPVECLAKTIYYEARGESEEGKRWVAYSVLNRTKHPKFPKDICSVVSEKHNGVCQFSWYCKGKKIKLDKNWDSSMKVAFDVINKDIPKDNVSKVLFFHAVSTRPTWGRHYKRIKRIDNHIFYGES